MNNIRATLLLSFGWPFDAIIRDRVLGLPMTLDTGSTNNEEKWALLQFTPYNLMRIFLCGGLLYADSKILSIFTKLLRFRVIIEGKRFNIKLA